jgi:two-component sensor histidine kinase
MRGTPTFYRIMGLPPTNQPVPMEVVRAVRHPDDQARVREGFQRALERGEDTYEAEYRIVRPSDGHVRWIFGRGRTQRDASGKPVRYSGVDIDITGRKEAEEHVRRLMQEVNHRANNLLAVVQAIAHHTLTSTRDPADFADRLSKRISGLSASNNLLVSGRWQGVDMRDLASSQLAHFVDAADRVELAGPPLRLGPSAAQAIGMALHELATNAVKYGALGSASGRVRLAWTLDGSDGERTFTLEWSEQGGPPVRPSSRTGFGHLVIGQMIEQALAGTTHLDLQETGLRWGFRGPSDHVLERNAP